MFFLYTYRRNIFFFSLDGCYNLCKYSCIINNLVYISNVLFNS
jgi:hypothetical protein